MVEEAQNLYECLFRERQGRPFRLSRVRQHREDAALKLLEEVGLLVVHRMDGKTLCAIRHKNGMEDKFMDQKCSIEGVFSGLLELAAGKVAEVTIPGAKDSPAVESVKDRIRRFLRESRNQRKEGKQRGGREGAAGEEIESRCRAKDQKEEQEGEKEKEVQRSRQEKVHGGRRRAGLVWFSSDEEEEEKEGQRSRQEKVHGGRSPAGALSLLSFDEEEEEEEEEDGEEEKKEEQRCRQDKAHGDRSPARMPLHSSDEEEEQEKEKKQRRRQEKVHGGHNPAGAPVLSPDQEEKREEKEEHCGRKTQLHSYKRSAEGSGGDDQPPVKRAKPAGLTATDGHDVS